MEAQQEPNDSTAHISDQEQERWMQQDNLQWRRVTKRLSQFALHFAFRREVQFLK